MKKLLHLHRKYWTSKEYLLAMTVSIALLILSFVANFYMGQYATRKASSAVTDIILDNIRVYDVEMIFVYGPIFLWLFVTALCLRRPEKIPFVIKSVALFILIRSVFISLTHIAPAPDQLLINYSSDFVRAFTFGGDLFFSAHTGLPFLMALVFGSDKRLLIIFTLISIFFGVIVLMAHVHYTIDVVSAFFITYTIFHLAKHFFKKDWKIFHEGLPLF
jgi:hypothetical protein